MEEFFIILVLILLNGLFAMAEISSENVTENYRLDKGGTDAFDVLFMGVKYFQHSMAGVCLPMRWKR